MSTHLSCAEAAGAFARPRNSFAIRLESAARDRRKIIGVLLKLYGALSPAIAERKSRHGFRRRKGRADLRIGFG